MFLANLASALDQYVSSKLKEEINKLTTIEKIDLTKIEPGSTYTTQYGSHLVHIYRRSKEDLANLDSYVESYDLKLDETRWISATDSWEPTLVGGVEDYVYIREQSKFEGLKYRSLRDDFLVVIGMDPQYRCNVKPLSKKMKSMLNAPKQSIFWHLCHGQFFDSSGREISKEGVIKKDGRNLLIPPHVFKNEKLLLGSSNLSLSEIETKADYTGLSSQEKLWKALRYSDYPALLESLKNGGNPNKKDKGVSPIDIAIIWSGPQLVKLLIDNGARPTKYSEKNAINLKRFVVQAILKNAKNSD